MSHHANVTRIKAVSNALGDFKNSVVFVGGATVSLYATRAADEARATDDVDIAVELASYHKYTEFEDFLREKGFQNDTTGHIGRFLLNGLIVDIIPTKKDVLGFFNKWYENGFANAIDYEIDPQHTVKIFPASYFVATKFEALKNREPKVNPRFSSDLEDIIFILENRSTIWEEMHQSDEMVAKYLVNEFRDLYKNPHIEELIDGHCSIKSPSSVYFILEDLEQFIQ
jgi:predicted nucleotidyltransferase